MSHSPEDLRALPDGTLEVRQRDDRRVLVCKSGSEIQLLFDSAESCEIQSRFDLDRPLSLVSAYTRAAMLGLLWSCPPGRVHVVGLGGGRIPMVLRHHFPGAVIDCTEIDPDVTDLAVRYFGVRIDDRLRVFHEDGRGHLEGHLGEASYDIVIVDAFTGAGFGAVRLASREFLRACGRRIAPAGVLVLSLLPGDPLLDRKLATVASAFRHALVYADDGVTVAFGSQIEPPGRHDRIERARRIGREHRLAFSLESEALKLGAPAPWIRPGPAGAEPTTLTDADETTG